MQGGSPGESRRPILLVDDSDDNVFLIEEYLRGSPYSVDVAANGVEALAMLKAADYELILMDQQMPGMDGRTATRIVRAWEADRGMPPTPILALTAHALQTEIAKSFEAGCNAHLSKPIQRQVLLMALAEHARPRPARITAAPPEGLENLAREYLTRRKEAMKSLGESFERKDYELIRRIAHDVKGTGASYGFVPLSTVAGLLEQAAAAGDLARMQQALSSMETYLQSVELAPPSSQAL
jgi:CheY-like chemotaxis protein